MNPDREILFPPFRLDLAEGRLWRGAEEIPIRPKTFAVLRALVERSGRLVTKEELLEAVWQGTHVNTAMPRIYVQELRELLEDDAETPRFIETVRGRGYRFRTAIGVPAPAISRAKRAPTMVGREAELARLQSWLEAAIAGDRRVVFVSGEPGIGKTTFIDAFLDRVAEDFRLWVAPGQCLEHHGSAEPYLPVLEALGRGARGAGGHRLVAILDRYAPSWLVQLPWLVGDDDRDRLQRAAAHATRDRMLREIAEALEVLTEETPCVLILEDLQASDHSTLDLIASLAERRERARLLVIGTFRPLGTLAAQHPLRTIVRELQVHRRCEQLQLEFLAAGDVADYLLARFPGSRLPSTLARVIHQRTDGNPLFMVSVVDYLVAHGLLVAEDGVWQLRGEPSEAASGVPETLRLILERQIEELTPEERRLLEAASVAGAEFATAAVAAALGEEHERVDEGFLEIVRKEQLVRARGFEEWPDGTLSARYRFIHSLYQELFYESLSPVRRARLHREIGERQERAYGQRDDDLAAQLALHFERGRDPSRAVRYLRKAGEKAIRRHAHHEAIAYVSKGLDLVQTVRDDAERIGQEVALRLALGGQLVAIKGYAAPEVERNFALARDLCLGMHRSSQRFPALHGLWVFYAAHPETKSARELAVDLMQLAEQSGERGQLLEAHWVRGATSLLLGELRSACSDLERAMELYDASKDQSHAFVYGQDPGTSSSGFAGIARWLFGDPDRALANSEIGIAHAERFAHPFSLAGALACAALVHQLRKETGLARDKARRVIALSEEQEFAFYLPWGRILFGWARTQEEEIDEGIAEMLAGLASLRTIGVGLFRPYFMGLLAEAHGRAGRPAAGMRVLDEALATVEGTGERFFEAELFRFKGELILRSRPSSSDRRSAEDSFRRAIAIARRQRSRSFELRATTSLSRLLSRSRPSDARRLLAKSYGTFKEGFETGDLSTARALLKTL